MTSEEKSERKSSALETSSDSSVFQPHNGGAVERKPFNNSGARLEKHKRGDKTVSPG